MAGPLGRAAEALGDQSSPYLTSWNSFLPFVRALFGGRGGRWRAARASSRLAQTRGGTLCTVGRVYSLVHFGQLR